MITLDAMKRCALILLIAALFSGCKSSSDAGKASDGYQLVWSDEFDGNAVDLKNWNYETGGHGWGNHEQQYYTDKNASIEDGNLVITAKAQQIDTSRYTS